MAVSRVVEFDDLTEKSLVNSLKRVLFQVLMSTFKWLDVLICS